jgi:hypothetical protein
VGDAGNAPLFPYGYGLSTSTRSTLPQLTTSFPAAGCGASNSASINNTVGRVQP